MPECMYKILRSSRFPVHVGGETIDMFISEVSFTPNRRFPNKIERHEGQVMTAVRNAWTGHEAEWNGYVVGGKRDGALIYENVPFKPLHWANSEDGSIPDSRPNGQARLIGFLRQINAMRNKVGGSWVLERSYQYPNEVQKIGSAEKFQIMATAVDGRYFEELVPLG